MDLILVAIQLYAYYSFFQVPHTLQAILGEHEGPQVLQALNEFPVVSKSTQIRSLGNLMTLR